MLKKVLIFLYILTFYFLSNLFAQQNPCDTLIINKNLEKSDSLAANSPREAMKLVDSALTCAKELNLYDFIAKCQQKKFEVYYAMGKYSDALNILRVLETFYQDEKDTLKLATVYNDMGLMNAEMSEYPKALELLQKAIKIRGNKKAPKEHGTTLGNIGMTYIYSEKWDDALNYTRQALEIFKTFDWQEGIATMNSNVGSIYMNTENFDSAKVYLNLSLEIYKNINHQEGISRVTNTLGMVYYYSGQVEESLVFFEESAKIRKEMGHQNGYLYALNNIAFIYNKLGRKKEAIKTFKEGLNSSDELDDKRVVILLLKNISDTYAQIEDYKSAFDYKQQYIKVNEEVINKEKTEQIEELKIEFETEQKESQIASLQKINDIQEESLRNRQIVIFLLIGSLILLGILGYLVYARFRLKSHQKAMELEQRLLRSQMNPHFIFNSLSVIQGYIFKDSPQQAASFLSSFGKLMRHILENSREEYVPFEKEIDTLSHYLELQNLRLDGKIIHSINIDENIDTNSMCIPPMIAQPFIENSIKHGMRGDEVINIEVNYQLKGEKIILSVEDDGVGISNLNNHTGNKNMDHNSLALSITQERLALLSKNKKTKFKMEIIDLIKEDSSKTGTKVIVELPYIEEF